MSRKLKPVSPGEMLAEEFLKPLGMSNQSAMTFTRITPSARLGHRFAAGAGPTTEAKVIALYRLAKEIGVPAQRVGDIIAGRRGITADTDLRLCRFFGLSDGWWLRLQADYDTEIARIGLVKTLAKIKPWSSSPARKAAARSD